VLVADFRTKFNLLLPLDQIVKQFNWLKVSVELVRLVVIVEHLMQFGVMLQPHLVLFNAFSSLASSSFLRKISLQIVSDLDEDHFLFEVPQWFFVFTNTNSVFYNLASKFKSQ